MSYRDRIGSHSQFDDERHWRFVRNSGLPRGTFDQRRSPDAVVFVVCVAIFVAGCVAVALGWI